MSTKAFQLVPVLERNSLLSDLKGNSQTTGTNVEITSLDCCTKNIYVGTSNGFIVQYVIDERKSGEKITFRVHLQGKRFVAKKAIQKLGYVACVDRAVLLVENTVCVFDTHKFDLSGGHDRLKNAHTFCIDENSEGSSPFGRKVCVASKRRHVQLYSLTADRWVHIRDIGVPEPALVMNMDSVTLCVGLSTKYILINTETAKTLDLFPYDRESDSQFITRVESGEFFLGGPSDLGMFVASTGVSQRPPIQLKSETYSLAISPPYLIALNPEFIAIHSIIDQQQKQTIKFQQGVKLQELCDRVLVASSLDIYALVPVPWQKQVDGLLADQKVAEALSLAQSSSRTSGLSSSQFDTIYSVILQKAGFIELSLFNFEHAQKHFLAGNVDPREVISLFPNLLSAESEFRRSRPSLHEFADINQIAKGDVQKAEDCKAWLVRYLSSCHPRSHQKKDVQTTLLKIYAENRPTDLLDLLQKKYQGFTSDTVEALRTFGRFHALAVFYQRSGQVDKALNIWSGLLTGDVEDNCFDDLGLPYFADVLSKMTDASLILNYAPVVLKKDPVVGAQIFTKGHKPGVEHADKRLRPEAIIEYLVGYPISLTCYLEHLVIKAKLQKETYHSHLAMVYLDLLLEAKQNGETSEVNIIRKKLQAFLKQSNKYSVTLILGRVERDDWLLPEAAILYGKAGDDKAALGLLVNRLSDFNGAEEYCVLHGAFKSTTDRQALFEILLRIYLDRTGDDERMRVRVIDLLNSPTASFNASKVAKLIPNDWSLALLSKFLLNTVRASLHQGRQARISNQLAYRAYFLANKDYWQLMSQSVTITDSRRCDECHQLFKESSFTRLTTGQVVHHHCIKSSQTTNS